MAEPADEMSHVKLQFSVTHPLLETCYCDGYLSATNEQGEELNPFKLETTESDFWLQGWWAGFYNETPLFSLEQKEDGLLDNKVDPYDVAAVELSANDSSFVDGQHTMIGRVAKVATAIAATALVGYQFLDMMA